MRDQQIKNTVSTLNVARRAVDNLARLVRAGVISEHEARQIMRIEPHDDYLPERARRVTTLNDDDKRCLRLFLGVSDAKLSAAFRFIEQTSANRRGAE